MTALLLSLWPGLAVSLGLGIAFGLLAGMPRNRTTVFTAALPIVALAALTTLAWLGTVPGRAGAWVEIAALLLAGYLGGCLLGALAGRLSGRVS